MTQFLVHSIDAVHSVDVASSEVHMRGIAAEHQSVTPVACVSGGCRTTGGVAQGFGYANAPGLAHGHG